MKTALIIRHVPYEGVAGYRAPIEEAGYLVDRIDVTDPDFSRADLNGPDLLIMMGGPMGVYEQEQYPWIACQLRRLARRLEAQRPTLGVCFGGTEVNFTGFPGGLCLTYTGFAPESYCVQANGLEFVIPTRADGGYDFWCGQSCFALGSSPRPGYRCAPVYYPDAGLKGGVVWPEACTSNTDCTGATATQCNTTYGQCCISSSSPLTASTCSGLRGL